MNINKNINNNYVEQPKKGKKAIFTHQNTIKQQNYVEELQLNYN